ncbi:hypothetical protein D3879_15520 [Pseudomonas cavernicola]|uniref:Protein BatD n=1 Tax=Pseudomonas cavernicola TaxID=2320866 RepID=A0A418XEW8_9PSED|nr:BatD family protein [Pseudomonas cavernicola]RJG11074.1 hypothetical protein D3879_15520 [Pseudomonas cavernicola]
MKRLLLVLCCLWPLLASAAPKVLVEARITPAGTAVVGSTLHLEVDVLVDTWFTAAPQLPPLQLSGALVTPPGGEAVHLTQVRDGETFFGLRYTYLITPTQAQPYSIPALSISVQAGQASAPLTVQSQPLSFISSQPAGVAPGQNLLVAQTVKLDQQVSRSANPLKVGDSITRQLTTEAVGAQAMLIPPPEFAEVKGLKRYLKTPQVSTLGNGRGDVSGGQRSDSVTYVVDQPGHYTLPAIELKWWDASANRIRTSTVPALEVEASANSAYQAPFSIADDLRQLGQQTRVRLSRHWLALAALLLFGGALLYWGRPVLLQGRRVLLAWRETRQQAYLSSATYAWQQVSGELNGQPPQLSALYLWAKRSQGAEGLQHLADDLTPTLKKQLLGFLESCYGAAPQLQNALQSLRQTLPALHRQVQQQRPQPAAKHGLAPLNPRQPLLAKEGQ